METEYQVQFLNRRPKTISEQNTTMTIDLQTARSISLCGQKTFSLEICLLDAIKYYCQTSDGAKLAEERLKTPLSGIYDINQKHSLVYLLKTTKLEANLKRNSTTGTLDFTNYRVAVKYFTEMAKY